MALFEPGDRGDLRAVLVSFPEQIRLCGAEPVLLRTRERTASCQGRDLEPHAGRQGVLLNSPATPRRRDSRRGVERLAAFASRTGALVIATRLRGVPLWRGTFASFAAHAKSLRDAVLVNSPSRCTP